MTAPVSVALSMLTFVPDGMGGSETYALELVKALDDSPQVTSTTLVGSAAAGRSGARNEIVVEGVGGSARSVGRVAALVRSGGPRRLALRALYRQHDLVHVPFTVAVPRPPRGIPLVQTLLDVQHLDLPHLFSPAERAYRHWFYDRTARHADVVITISDFCKQRIVARLGIDPARIIVAPLGVRGVELGALPQDREAFLLYPARGWAHKNHALLVEGVRLARREQPRLRLVLTGGGLEGLGPLPDWVEVRGLVPSQELQRLYATAQALVFPSLYEGFGLPPLEAMARGCPVVTSTAGALPETCGDAAVYFEPSDPHDLARAITDARGREVELSRAGAARASDFTWQRCAQAHERAYAAAAS